MIRAMEGTTICGVEAEIQELERRFEVAGGKAQADYHEQLEKLKHDSEALKEELSRMR